MAPANHMAQTCFSVNSILHHAGTIWIVSEFLYKQLWGKRTTAPEWETCNEIRTPREMGNEFLVLWNGK
jgi:hypothetical protein